MSVLPEGSRVGVDPFIIPTGEWPGSGLLCPPVCIGSGAFGAAQYDLLLQSRLSWQTFLGQRQGRPGWQSSSFCMPGTQECLPEGAGQGPAVCLSRDRCLFHGWLCAFLQITGRKWPRYFEVLVTTLYL